MKFLIVFVALFAVALAAPPQYEAQVLRLDSEVGPESFRYDSETSDGTKTQAEGHLENIGHEDEAIAVKGSYSWVDPEGHSHSIVYVADKYGYQPQGADIPVAPVA